MPSGTSIEGVAVRTLGGNDTVTAAAGSPLTSADTGAGNDTISLAAGVTLDIVGGTGTDTVNVVGTAGNDAFSVTAGASPFGSGRRSLLSRLAARAPRIVFELLEIAYNAVAAFRNLRLILRERPALIYERHAFFLC